MKTDDKDILKTARLKENPFSVPEGYFSSFKSTVFAYEKPKKGHDLKRFGLGVAAASLVLLAVTGIRLSKSGCSNEDIDSIDLIVFSDMCIETCLDLMAVHEEQELTEEDIIEYLIQEETLHEHIEANE